MHKRTGTLVISLDFELYWGMFDKVDLDAYGANILGVRQAIPRILTLFSERNIHATWAVVGMLMHARKGDLVRALPSIRPTYDEEHISSYHHLEHGGVGADEYSDPYHFGLSLVQQISATPHQELGSHTFSHYYCLETGQTPEQFCADLEAAKKTHHQCGIQLRSLVFPRNQSSEVHCGIAASCGVSSYRGNQHHYLYAARDERSQSSVCIRVLRFIDAYMNISGNHTSVPLRTHGLINIPASRFLRPWSPSLRYLEPLKIRRITKAMSHAAERGEVFHLWWHPHNFGVYLDENMHTLEVILDYFALLSKRDGMQSMTMTEVAHYYA